MHIPAEWLPRYTYADYARWEGDWELIQGMPYAMSPAPTRRHQFVGGKFVHLFIDALKKRKSSCNCEVLYESDWIVNADTVVRPDVMIVCDTPQSDFVRTPPVLIFEILSPGTKLKDRNLKFTLYKTNGVRYYLMADPERNTIEAFQLQGDVYEPFAGRDFELAAACDVALNLDDIWQ